MNETLEQFAERMGQVDKECEYQVGPWYRGHTRAMFVFEGQQCFMETTGCTIVPPRIKRKASPGALLSMVMKPMRSHWWVSFSVRGKGLAERIAKHYGGDIEEEWYSEHDDWHFCFKGDSEDDDGFAKLMRFVYDRHTGKFFDEFRVGGRDGKSEAA